MKAYYQAEGATSAYSYVIRLQDVVASFKRCRVNNVLITSIYLNILLGTNITFQRSTYIVAIL